MTVANNVKGRYVKQIQTVADAASVGQETKLGESWSADGKARDRAEQ